MTCSCLVIGWFGYNNIGDELILHSLIRSKKFASLDITAISADPKQTERIHGIKSVPFGCSIFVNLHKSDVIVFGGGQIFSDKRIRTIPLWTAFMYIASFINRKRKVILLNQGFEAQNIILRRMLRLSLSKADFISVRDSNSLTLIKRDLDVSAPFSFGPDMVFSLNNKINTNIARAENIVGVNIRPMFWWASNFCSGLSDALIASVLDRLIEERNVKIVFMPFRLLGKETHSDQEAAKSILKKMKYPNKAEIFACPLNENLFNRLEERYETFDFFIGMALHSLIFACKSAVPFLAIPYQKKCELLMVDQGLKDYVINQTETSSTELLFKRIITAFDERHTTKASLLSLSKNLYASSVKAHLSNYQCE